MFTIRLASGLEVSVISIEMSGTYSGVLEGAPGKDLNNELLRDVLELDGEEGYYIKCRPKNKSQADCLNVNWRFI